MFDHARLEDGSIVERAQQTDALSRLRLWAVVVGLGLFAVVTVSTALLQAPQHQALVGGFHGGAHEFLLSTNWIKTAAWAAYGILGLWMMWQVARGAALA
jgi:hypothetical protein